MKGVNHHWFLIPKTESRLLSSVLVFLILVFLGIGATILIGMTRCLPELTWPCFVLFLFPASAFFLTAAGLWSVKRWASVLAQIFCCMIGYSLLVFIAGLLLENFPAIHLPFDPAMHGPLLITIVILWAAFWCVLIYVLSKFKAAFK